VTMILPNGLSVRAPTKDEAPDIASGVGANEISEQGKAETTSDDVVELWEDMGTDLQSDARVIVTQESAIIGYVGVSHNAHGSMLDVHSHVHPTYHHQGLEHFLLQFAEERTISRLEHNPTLPRLIKASSYRQAWTQALTQEGYVSTTGYWRMEIKLDNIPPTPQLLDSIAVRQYHANQQEEEAIHTVIQQSFRDIGGHPYRPFDEWKQGVLGRSHFDPAMLYVALNGETIVGAIICCTYPEQSQGQVVQIAVLRPWRKQGIAMYLLETVFGEYYQRGIANIFLDVDGHNATGAHQLYEHAGMHKTMQIDHMEKKLP
jgi:mycothiol synthase